MIPYAAKRDSRQLGEFFTTDGAAERDLAMERLENRYTLFCDAAYRKIEYLARTQETFTSDDVWLLLEGDGQLIPPEHRSMGAPFHKAKKNGLIVRTADTIPTNRPQAHRRWIPVWRRTNMEPLNSGGRER